jgi:hypothetical protein
VRLKIDAISWFLSGSIFARFRLWATPGNPDFYFFQAPAHRATQSNRGGQPSGAIQSPQSPRGDLQHLGNLGRRDQQGLVFGDYFRVNQRHVVTSIPSTRAGRGGLAAPRQSIDIYRFFDNVSLRNFAHLIALSGSLFAKLANL